MDEFEFVGKAKLHGASLIWRFFPGETVWVRDRRLAGYSIVQAVVREQHYHPDRHPSYPNGEGYALDGELWWDCYPGCRVFATKDEAKAARIGEVRKWNRQERRSES